MERKKKGGMDKNIRLKEWKAYFAKLLGVWERVE